MSALKHHVTNQYEKKQSIQISFIEALPSFDKSYKMPLKTLSIVLSRGNSTNIHSTQHTGRTYTITHVTPPSVSTEDVIHIKVHTYRSSYKEIKHTHTVRHSDGIIEARQKYASSQHSTI